MDKYSSVPGHSGSRRPASVAASVHDDFAALVSMLDGQLAKVAAADERARAHIVQAKAAAERGLALSERLIELLQNQAALD